MRMVAVEHNEVVLAAEGITKRFGGIKALDGAHLSIQAGQVHAVVGENGAGKSTLMKVLAGVHRDYEGRVLLAGREVAFANPRQAQEAGIAIIHQELNLIAQLSIAENVFLGREFLNPLGLIDFRKMYDEAGTLLDKLDLHVDPRRSVSELRVGQQQIVEIAKALALDARVIIMDEPTSAISEREVEVLFRLIASLTQRGVAVVYISHKLDEVSRIADRITVMRDGRTVGSRACRELSHDDIVRMMVGRDVDEFFAKAEVARGTEALRVEGIRLDHPDRPGDYLVRDISFSVHRGEVLGLFGLMGAGRTELFETIFGLHAQSSTGRMSLGGAELHASSPLDAIEAGLALVPEDRKLQGLILDMSVTANISLASIAAVERCGFLSERRERILAADYANRLRIKTASQRQSVKNLSGGNQQKVVIAKWLATKPKVLLLDEPTRGIDVNAKNEIYKLISELAAAGLAIVMSSSELPEIMTIADRIIVLSEGRQTAEFPRATATEESILKAALPRSLSAS
ncbi:MAG: sugar ABC transporter ATP-binding protein [Phycisphaerales bacterium]|nr:MAG: sugar ABC transporter ATP-binding protein [Phycisphaerales bacterium]